MDNRSRVPTQPGGVANGATVETGRVSGVQGVVTQNTNEVGESNSAAVKSRKRKVRKKWPKLRKIGLGVLFLGILALGGGIGFLVYNLSLEPEVSDAEYLVEVGEWKREDEPSVTWEFTEIGEGKLSTNKGENEYDFQWALEDGKLKIDTEWLYTLNDEFEFSLDQEEKTFTVAGEDETFTFVEK